MQGDFYKNKGERVCSFTFKSDYTASERLENVKSLIFNGGMRLPFTLTGAPMASRLLSMITGLSLNLKFLIGYLICPFSM